jgi:sugar lactone lactonase YvrE
MRASILWRILACQLCLVSAALAQQEAAQVLPPSHSVKPELYATGFEFAEGPAFDKHGNLYVANYRGFGNIGRITPDGTASVFCNLDNLAPVEGRKSQANGLKVDSNHRLIVADAGAGRVLRVSADGTMVEVLADRYDGHRFNSVNDVALDRAGNIYFTDPGGSSVEHPTGAVYRYDLATKKVTQLVKDMAFPNGLGVTPDQKHLVVAESHRQRLLIFDITPAGELDNRRVLCEFPAENQGEIRGGKFNPDGLIFDNAGRCYVGMWTGGVINVVEVPSGKLLRQYDAGGGKATNCHFFGPHLYVTIAAKEAVFRLKLDVDGHRYVIPSED